MSAEHFNFYSDVLHYGNRVDCEHLGTGKDDDWYSWDAHLSEDDDVDAQKGAAYITVSSNAPEAAQYYVTWERIQ